VKRVWHVAGGSDGSPNGGRAQRTGLFGDSSRRASGTGHGTPSQASLPVCCGSTAWRRGYSTAAARPKRAAAPSGSAPDCVGTGAPQGGSGATAIGRRPVLPHQQENAMADG